MPEFLENEVLAHLNQCNQRECLLLINLVSRYSEQAKANGPETSPPPPPAEKRD